MTRKLRYLTGALLAATLAAPAGALAAPVLEARISHEPASGLPVASGGVHSYIRYVIAVSNSGDARASGPITVEFDTPAGLTVLAARSDDVSQFVNEEILAWNCTVPDSQSAACTGPSPGGEPEPGEEACVSGTGSGYPSGSVCRIVVTAKADPALQVGDVVTPSVEVCGGAAAACAGAADPTPVTDPIPFAITDFGGGAYGPSGEPPIDLSGPEVTAAGTHPQTAETAFILTEAVTTHWLTTVGVGFLNPVDPFKDVVVDLPPGLVGNPRAVPTCSEDELMPDGFGQLATIGCPPGSQVGAITIHKSDNFSENTGVTAYNTGLSGGIRGAIPLLAIDAPEGRAATFAFALFGVRLQLLADLVRDEGVPGGYRVRATVRNSPVGLPLKGAGGFVWGVPADPSNDEVRGWDIYNGSCLSPDNTNPECARPNPSPEPRRAFFTLPTSCDGPVQTDITVTGWGGNSDTASFLSPAGTDCASLPFAPTLRARPSTNVADSPSGLDVELHVPQDTFTNPDGVVTAHLKDTTVVLPEGLNVNPSSANGLDACSSAQIELNSTDHDNCPDASKLGTVAVETPLLENPLPGAVYLARPFDNPFNSLLAIYIVIDDPISGTVAKIAGHVQPDPVTGRLTTTVKENPQVPFEDFTLNFFGGAGGSLRTPAVCGEYSTNSQMTPWSGTAPVDSRDPWRIEQGPQGSCASSAPALPHAPGFDAGTVSPIAKASSPFVVNLRRDDGSQEFSALNLTPPQGLVAKLAGTATCPQSALDAAAAKSGREEQANPSCPAASEVGSVDVQAGAGPAPYNAKGKAYLSGPHKGAPLSLAVITPAVAGPFDLGAVVVKTALYVDPKTAQVSARSDPIPHIIDGIVLDVRSIAIKMDKPDFILNPTSCDPMAVNGDVASTLGAVAPLQSRFQLAECSRLPFKPNLVLKLRGGTTRGKYPALTGILTTRPGDANIAYASVALPKSEFLANEHIRTICTRPDFAADNCPAGAIYGEATVDTPLLDYDLSGRVYLRSSSNLLPDLVPDLRGPAHQPIKIESAGRTDSIGGGIRNTFDFVPDAPFTRFTLRMQGGTKGLLVNSRDICRRAYRATVRFIAHNGMTYVAKPKMQANCKKKGKKKKGKRGGGHKRNRAVAQRSAVR